MEEVKIVKKIKIFYSRFERYLIPSALLLGFLVDLITFRLINFSTALLLLFFYLFLASFSIIFINFYDAGFWRFRFLSPLRIFAPLIVQYSFGAILSASMIFYSFSGSIFTSWPFILVLLFLFLANEIFKKHYKNLVVQLSILFFVAFSLFILVLPYVTRILGFSMFIFSGILSLIFIFLLIWILEKKVLNLREKKRKIIISILLIFGSVNIFYFTNTIPPFPLSVRQIGIYHSLERTSDGNYKLGSEETGVLDIFSFYKKFKITSVNEEAYAFSSVFSPARLNTEIFHEWQYLDPNGKWITFSEFSFPIVGGRKNGYRGYSRKDNIVPGKWRINVKTKAGQVVGRMYVKVELVDKSPVFEEVII